MSTYTCLFALVPCKKQPTIRVKIVRTWKSSIATNPPRTCLVIGDEHGTTIEATIPSDVTVPFGVNLNEGDWFEIYDFKLIHASGLIRTTRNKYHIILTQNALLTKIHPMTEFNFLCCVNYETILRGLSHPKFCIDLCGALFHVGPLEDINQVQPNPSNGGYQSRILFTIINSDFDEINCIAYGTVAEKLYENWLSSTEKIVVCVLKLWRIQWGKGHLTHITNFEDYSDILFDPEITEIQNFRTMFSVLSELQRKSEDAAIRVKIISKWNTVGGARPPHCQMILGDEKGSTMEATLPFEVLLPEGIYLEEADWMVQLRSLHLISIICVDLCGAMVALGELQQLEELGPGEIFSYQNTRMEFTLVNTELKHLKCVAYGKEAVTLNEYNLNSRAPVNVCVLRYITNLESSSQVLFDQDMAEIQNFKSKIPMPAN
ncbi:hypothetical protein F2Q69_00020229 [Brassica cretica]|uniref:Replication protein A 70 kDa DNA-binding subunit B/D first OB fold domain-containing protein n=1 Tax=Brassica cretica TaxID=69181 RepID=A0A8S9Q4F4_BRACR|nr:hypothetical protein F2Q69_00020229 [Brassica cretica]